MSNLEMIFFWISLVIYSLATGGFIYSFVFKNPRFMPKMTLLIGVAFITHTIAICARYSAQGHLPWSGDYESAMMGGWFIIAGTLFVGWRNRALQALATVSGALPLYGSTNTMQCATCHDPHSNVNTNYLRQANNAAHCTTCHL